MFSFYTIWFGLYRIYTFGVSYLFLMVVLHLRYMTVVFTSPLLGLCLLKAPLNGVLRDHWPFCWQILDFLLSPHNKFLPSKEQPGDSNSHTYPVTRTGRCHCGSHCQSHACYLHRACRFSSNSLFPLYCYWKIQAQAWSPSGNYLVIRNRPKAVL